MIVKSHSELKVFENNGYKYIYVYYKQKGVILRYNTKYIYQKSYCTTENLFNSKYPDYKKCNENILELKRKVNEYITYKQGFILHKLNQKELNDWVTEKATKGVLGHYNFPSETKVVDKKKKLLDYYDDFYEFKKKELNNRPSYKDYLSLYNALKDWEKMYNKSLVFRDINSEEFMVDFCHFLSESRNPDIYLTGGGLNDNTIHKRISSLKTFLNWVEQKDYFLFKRSVTKFKVAKYDNDIIALDKADLQTLLDLNVKNDNHQKLIDLFVFNCFCGLRFSDLVRLKPIHFKQDEDGDYYVLQENKKTNITVNIPLQKTALSILQKYDFKLPKFSSQHFNREFKNVLEEYELFEEPIIKKRRVLKQNMDYESIRRKHISSHTCRRTFITLALNANVPTPNIMAASGHKKLQTLKKYGKISQNKNAFRGMELGDKTGSN
ncbi:tyrosine-type recombinase/integrase [Prolixibacteraceae bacterium Z1-6]|uniref:Tyrosine-type recombinase/integrase n=1 Tax=Draconibacterium aestuarii TaxID=2998507 RepID=A0A9X3J4W0_9BACT|nr:tyrosine-type recombinase/integrase [Prolixibacteraceae bacterium Z1-6]